MWNLSPGQGVWALELGFGRKAAYPLLGGVVQGPKGMQHAVILEIRLLDVKMLVRVNLIKKFGQGEPSLREVLIAVLEEIERQREEPVTKR